MRHDPSIQQSCGGSICTKHQPLRTGLARLRVRSRCNGCRVVTDKAAEGKKKKFDWCYFYDFVRNSPVPLLEALCAMCSKWTRKCKGGKGVNLPKIAKMGEWRDSNSQKRPKNLPGTIYMILEMTTNICHSSSLQSKASFGHAKIFPS